MHLRDADLADLAAAGLGDPGAAARVAHQRRPRAGAETTPSTKRPSASCSAMTGGPHRHPAHEVLGAVDGVDDPAAPAAGADELGVLLAQHPVLGALDGHQHRTHEQLDRPVGVADRGEVGLGLDHEVASVEPVHRDGVGRVGDAQREREVVGVSGHAPDGIRRGSEALGRSTVAEPPGRP